MKKRSVILAVLSIMLLTACTNNKKVEEVQAKGNDYSDIVVETDAGSITKDEFYDALVKQYGVAVLQEMITVKVLQQTYDVSEEDVDREVEIVKNQLGDQFDLWLQYQKFGDEELFRNKVLLTLLQEEAKADGVNVSEEEIEEHYERLKTEVNAQHILVKTKEEATEVQEKLANGAEFSELAKQYSTDSSNANNGGELGFFSVGTMVPEFEEAAYSLNVGEVSEPVVTQYGYHIIKIMDKREKQSVPPYENVKQQIRQQLVDEKIELKEVQDKILKLIEDAGVDIKIEGFDNIFQLIQLEEHAHDHEH